MPPIRPVVSLLALLAALTRPAASQPVTTFDRDKAVTLLRERLPCLGCHALGSEGGRLAPDLATVGTRRSAAYVAAMIDDPQRVVPGTIMPRTLMPASSRALVVRYLTAGATASGPPPVAQAAPPIDTSGARLYARLCAGCHGTGGAGDGPNARFLPVPPAVHASRAAMSTRTDDRLYDAIAGGGELLGRNARMPAFGATLTPAQIRALVRQIRTLCACAGPSWSADGETMTAHPRP